MIKSATASSSESRAVVEPTGRMVLPQPSRRDSFPPFRSSRDFDKLKLEKERLETFSLPPGWPIASIPPEQCAKSGFFFLQDGDKVQCAFCRGIAGEWEEGDDPAVEHRRHFPRCPFVCNLPVGNVPLGCELEAAQLREQVEAAGIDICGPFALAPRYSSQESASVRGAQPLNGNLNDVATSLAIQVCGNGPVHSNLVTLQSRLKTFSNWPSTSGQTVQALADAGFFYIGRFDHVKCFYCDGGLRNWEPGDDPWLEHARWFPNCSFVVLNKGDNFVKEVSKDKPPNSSEACCSRKHSSGSDVEESVSQAILKGAKQPATRSLSQSSDDSGVSSNENDNPLEELSGSESESISSSSHERKENNDVNEESFSLTGMKKEIELEEELRKLREATQCKICMDNRVEVVFLPCGHLVSCTRCATALSNCAVCRQPIKAYVKTYLS